MKIALKAWAIVNKDFESNIVNHPSLFGADIFFTEGQARQELENRHPKFCGECGRKNKKQVIYLKVIPVEIKI